MVYPNTFVTLECFILASVVSQRKAYQLSKQSDDEYAMLDATIVKAHQHSAGKKGIKPLDAAKVD